jgi:hypothetical protein
MIYKFYIVVLTLSQMILLSVCTNSSHVFQRVNNQCVTAFYVLLENSENINIKTSVGEGFGIGEMDRILINV